MNTKVKFIAVFLAALFSAAHIYSADVKVVSVSGKCEFESDGTWKPIEVGQPLSAGTKIQTGFKSELVLSLLSSNEDSTITIAPLSRMTIEQLISNDKLDKTNIYMDTGSVKSEINRTSDVKVNFTVRSPVATASVRGTILSFKNVVGGCKVVTERGRVAVWNSKNDDEQNIKDEEAEIEIPATAAEVVRFQEVQLSDTTGKNKTTLESATSNAVEITSSKTAAESEAVSVGSSDTASVVVNTVKKGSLNVSVNWE